MVPVNKKNECCLLHLHCVTPLPPFLSNLLFLEVLSTCRWVCFLVLLQLAENVGRFSRTLISRFISPVFPFGHASLPCLSLSCNPRTFDCSSIILSFKLGVNVSAPHFYLCIYLYPSCSVWGLDGFRARFTHSFLNHSLPSHSACFDSLEISCYMLWYCKFPWYSLSLT